MMDDLEVTDAFCLMVNASPVVLNARLVSDDVEVSSRTTSPHFFDFLNELSVTVLPVSFSKLVELEGDDVDAVFWVAFCFFFGKRFDD